MQSSKLRGNGFNAVFILLVLHSSGQPISVRTCGPITVHLSHSKFPFSYWESTNQRNPAKNYDPQFLQCGYTKIGILPPTVIKIKKTFLCSKSTAALALIKLNLSYVWILTSFEHFKVYICWSRKLSRLESSSSNRLPIYFQK